ncbi:MAG: DUF3310 domain-containing protein [Rhizobium sp.]|nr:MAG: DUF3310 domain-containing protein [Rhizobium sp.]
MEGTEARIEKREKPVWQQPSGAASYNAVTQPAHYARFAIQPIEFILANGLNFLQASVIKYLVRYPYKNGMEDLLKCRNMLDRLIAEEQRALEKRANPLKEKPAGVVKRPVTASPLPGASFWINERGCASIERWHFEGGVQLATKEGVKEVVQAIVDWALAQVWESESVAAPPYPSALDFRTPREYHDAISEWTAKYGKSVGDAREEVGGQPASDHAEHGADSRDGSK